MSAMPANVTCAVNAADIRLEDGLTDAERDAGTDTDFDWLAWVRVLD